jgi:hypothetical protein
MTKQVINVGQADKGNGDPIRTAFVKVNYNFNELYELISQINSSILNIKLDGGSASTTYDTNGLNVDGGVSTQHFEYRGIKDGK